MRAAGRVVVIGLSVEFRGATRDVVAELPFGATVASLAAGLAHEIDYAPPFVEIEVVRTGALLPRDAVAADCDLRSGDLVQLRPSSRPQGPVEVSLKERPADGEPLVRLQSRPAGLRGARRPGRSRPGEARPALELHWNSGATAVEPGQYLVGSGATSELRLDLEGLPDVAFELAVSPNSARARSISGSPQLSIDGTVVGTEWHELGLQGEVRSAGARMAFFIRPHPTNEHGSTRLFVGERPKERTRIHVGGRGEIPFNRPPRRSSLWRPSQFELPEPPAPLRRARIPFVAALVPLVGGLAMFLFLKDPLLLAFMGLSPIMAASTYFTDRRSGRKDHAEAIARFEAQLAEAGNAIYETIKREVVERHAQSPQLATIVRWAGERDDRLWKRRPWDSDFLALPLGWGRLPAMTRISAPSSHTAEPDPRIQQLVAQYAEIDDLPYVVHLAKLEVLGFSGDRPTSVDAARALMLQAVLLHSPSYLGIAAVLPRGGERGWEWLKWLPHTRTAAGALEGPALGAGNRGLDVLQRLAALERRRLVEHETPDTRGHGHGGPALLVVIDEELQFDRALVADVLGNAQAAGVAIIWVGGDPRGLPGQCRITADTAPNRTAQVVEIETGIERSPIRLDAADASVGETVARAMAPVRDASSADASASIPTRVRLLEQIGSEAPSAQQLAEMWHTSRGGLGAVIGACAGEPMQVDLRTDGPHALIAGTTGAGKSELLRTIVAALAARHPPSRLTFLLVDYKGGAAFAPCRMFPHVLDVVSDLDAELGERALISLDAEMKRRERLLSEQQADNLIDLERRRPELAPPNLVIMVDEFAKLREEIPDFIDGVVDVAQRGRTLGIHMILAAQSLRTAFTPAVRANTNLRIALRVTSETESQDVVDAPDAARIPSGDRARGRAFARIGHERLIEFQTAHVSGRYADPQGAEAVVRSFGFDTVLAPAARRSAGDDAPGVDETDLAALAHASQAASKLLGIPAPRPAWTPPLPRSFPRSHVQRHTRAVRGLCAIGLVDEPEHQRQTPLVLDLERGHVAVFGFSGAGKTTALQTIAASLAWDASPDQVQIYCIDAASGALAVIDPLPHVGAIVRVSDPERVERLLNRLEREARERSNRFSAAGAAKLSEYAQLSAAAGSPPRIVLLIDGFGEFASAYDDARPNSPFERLLSLLAIGRTAGVHVVIAADRRAAVRSQVSAHISQRLVMHCGGPDDAIAFGIPTRLADRVELGPGRCFTWDSHVAQLALPSPSTMADAVAGFQMLAAHLREAWPGLKTPDVEAMPAQVEFARLGVPTSLASIPIAIGGDDLESYSLDLSERNCLVAGPYRSGRSNALCVIGAQVLRGESIHEIHVLAPRKSPLLELGGWDSSARGPDACAELAKRLAVRLDELSDTPIPRILVLIDDAGELQDAASWNALERIVRIGRDRGMRVVAAAETSAARMLTNPWLRELRKDGQGLLLLPESQVDGDVLGVALPRRQTTAMVTGRGYLASRGAAVLIQVPLLASADHVHLRSHARARDVVT